VRLITVDRPGVGGTDPVADPTRAAHAADVVALLDALELDAVDVVGWSGGGQFALVAADALDGRARSLTLMCSPAPDTEVRWLPDPMRELAATIADDPVAGAAIAQEAAAGFVDPDMLAGVDEGESDARTRERDGVVERLRAMYVEAVRQGPVGPAFDIVAGSRDANLPAPRIRARLFYGDDDQQVGVEHGRWYAERLGAQLTVVAGAGHLLPLDHWAEVLNQGATS
jgi:pimeloyl-ACP methyl ester carboxylesterase